MPDNRGPQKISMHVLHIITGLSQGGAEAMLTKLVKELSQKSCTEHRVVSLTDDGIYGKEIRSFGIDVKSLGMKRTRWLSYVQIMELRQLIREYSPDVVQTWLDHSDLLGGIAAKSVNRRTPVFWNIRHSNPGIYSTRPLRKGAAYVHRLLSRWVPDRIIVNSHAGMQMHEKAGYSNRKMICIPNAFDTEKFMIDRSCSVLHGRGLERVHPSAKIIGMVARYNSLKDHGTLLRAFKSVLERRKDVCLLLCGANIQDQNRRLVEQIKQLGIQNHVKMLGPIAYVSEFMNSLDVFVLSSVSEGFPNVIGEAMACGIPCVSTDVGDAARIIGDTGWLVSPGDHAAMGAAILEAINEPGEDAAERRNACRTRILDHYQISQIANNYYAVWQSSLSRANEL